MKRLSLLASAVVFAGLAGPAWAASDQEFLSKAIKGDVAEVEMGKLALSKGATPGLKAFAQTLVTDHSEGKSKADAVAKEIGLAPPADASPDAKSMYRHLSGLSGAEFEKQFVAHMVEDHEKDIAEYKQEAASGKGKVAELAKESLPVLEKHLKIAKDLQAKS
jgi:putative membrane protein